MGYEGGGGANFLTSDGLQIFFGALYHEMVLSTPEHNGSGNVEFLSPELLYNGIFLNKSNEQINGQKNSQMDRLNF